MKICERDDLDTARLGDMRHRLLAMRERAGDEHRVVSTLGETIGQVRHVQCRTADVEAREDAENLNTISQAETRSSSGGRRRAARQACSRESAPTSRGPP